MKGVLPAALVVLVASCSGPGRVGEEAGRGSTEVSPQDAQGKDPASPRGVRVKVTRVVDGDTFEVRLNGEIVDVRMIGVDAPETVHPEVPVECYGPEASEFTHRRLGNRTVRLEQDVEPIDDFGRTLAYVWLGERLFNEDLIRQGYATLATFPPNVAYVERLVEAERKARRDGLGIWGECLVPVNIGADWRDLGDA